MLRHHCDRMELASRPGPVVAVIRILVADRIALLIHRRTQAPADYRTSLSILANA